MSRLSLAFFTAAAFCALCGMVWGIQMGISDNLTMGPAHAHLNLVGWASLALMGGFYTLAGERAPTRLGWINFILSASAVVVMIPGLAVMLSSASRPHTAVIIGSLLALSGMATFFLAVLSLWRAPHPAKA